MSPRRRGALIAAALVAAASSGAPLGAQEAREANVEERTRWLRELRDGADGAVDADRAIAAWERARRLPLALSPAYDRAPGGVAAGPVAWRPVGPFGFISASNFWISGPQPDAGRVAAVALHPTEPAVLFAGSAGGGLWRTENGGASWRPLTDAECSTAVGAVAVDPVDPRVIWLGTGERTGSSASGCGLLRSTDGGETWTRLGADVFAPAGRKAAGFARLAVDARTAGTAATTALLAATDLGLFRSEDGGARWTRVLAGAAWDVVASPARPGTFYASLTDGTLPVRGGVYRSDDGGERWTRLGAGWPNGSDRVELAVSPADPTLLLASAGERGTQRLLGLYAWREGAEGGWRARGAAGLYDTRLQRGDFGAQANYSVALAIDPADASRVLLGGVRLFASSDSGATFARVADNVHSDWQDIVFDPRAPGRVVGASDGGLFVSTDGGRSWTSRNAGLQTAQFYPGVSAHPTDASVILGGTQDNGTLVASAGSLWEAFASGDGGYTAINPVNPRVAWISGYWSGGPNLWRRGPETFDRFSYRATGIATSDRAQFFPPLVMDPARPTTLYLGTHRLWRTTDDGASWLPISGDLTRGSGSLTTIAVGDSGIVYTGASDGAVQVSSDSGRTFALRAAGLPNRRVTRIVLDPADSRRALATFNGYGGGHVYLTTDAGLSWRDASGPLPDGPVYAALVLRADDWLVGTDYGVFRTTDAGATWGAAAPGLPSVMVTDLIARTSANDVLAATHGRGLFSLPLAAPAPALRGDVNRDGAVDAADALLVAQYLAGIALPVGVAVHPAGDADCDGVVDATDVVVILRAAAGLPTPGACVGEKR